MKKYLISGKWDIYLMAYSNKSLVGVVWEEIFIQKTKHVFTHNPLIKYTFH